MFKREKSENGLQTLAWEKPPVEDATAPEIVGSRGQRIRFFTQKGLEQIYYGCKLAGLQIVGIKGQLISGGIMAEVTRTEFTGKKVKFTPFGTATEKKPDGTWNGPQDPKTFYRVTVMAPTLQE